MSAPQTPTEANPNRAVQARRSVLAWSAGRRLVAVLPALCVLWLAVWWASLDGVLL